VKNIVMCFFVANIAVLFIEFKNILVATYKYGWTINHF